ncbi:MAG: hypothetical protein ABIC40_03645 [bacterium]
MRKIFPAFLLMVLSLLPSFAQAEDEGANALDYLPPSRFKAGWVASGNELFTDLRGAAFLLKGDIPLLREFGLRWYATETYTNFKGGITIEIFQFPSASDAFGYYALSPIPYIEPSPSPDIVVKPYDLPPPADIDSLRLISNEFIEGYKDKFYIRVKAENEDTRLDLMDVATYVLGSLPGMAIKADIVSVLPKDGLVMGTERYIKGPVGLNLLLSDLSIEEDPFGFDSYSPEAAAGEYRLGGGEYFLLVVFKYKDTDSCTAVASALQGFFTDMDWQTLIVPPMESGYHPRAFSEESVSAFWPAGSNLWFCYDLTNAEKLVLALDLFDK